MDEKQGGTSSDSDFGDSWTIVDKNSFCNRMMDAISALDCDKVFEEYSELSNVRDCALCFQDDSNNDADADSDGISVISENEDHLMANPASTYVAAASKMPTPPSSPEPKTSQDTQQTNPWTTQPETRTPKKNKTKFNKPLTPPNTPVDCDSPVFDKPEKKHKKRSYIHNRNDKVSNILNILVAGTIATAAGLAFGHLMGSKSDCANLAAGMNSELSFKQLQYENQKLKNELQDLKRESWHFTNRFNKHAAKGRKNFTENTIPVTHVTENSPKFDNSKKHQPRDQNNNLKVPETSTKPVFFGPKTYADTISSNIKKFDDIGETHDNINVKQLSDIKNLDKKKCNSITNAGVHKTGLICSQELSSQEQNKTVRNYSFPNLLDSEIKSEVQESNKTVIASDRPAVNTNSENVKKSKQKNSKTKPTSVIEESAQDNHTENIENNVEASTTRNAKSNLKRKSNRKERSMSKKPRSISSGKESGDFGNSAISLDKLGESTPNQKTEKPHAADEEIEQQYGNKGSQKNTKQDHKPKDKAKERKNSSEYDTKVEKTNKKKSKFNKNQKFSEEDLVQNVKSEEKRNNRRDRKQSKINVEKNDQLPSQDDMKLNKDKRNSEKITKSRQKDDRRKSDFRNEKKDKYEEWEMNKGYEYYLSNDILLGDLSDDESTTSKVRKHTSEKTVSSSDEPVYLKKTKKIQKKNNVNMVNDVDRQSENWVYDPTEKASSTNSNTNNMDGSWVDDIAKYREEQRNKQQESDWVFERAKVRDMKRDKASWYFNRMNEREQCRAKERSKRNNSTKPRSSKKSPNYRSKL